MIWPYRLLIYLFPFVMWIIEYLIRLAIGQAHPSEFFAPSVAAVSAGLCMTVAVPKSFSGERFEALFGFPLPRHDVRSGLDLHLVPIGLMAVGLCFVAWAITLFVSLGGRFPPGPLAWMNASQAAYVGATMYFLAVVLTEFKERA